MNNLYYLLFALFSSFAIQTNCYAQIYNSNDVSALSNFLASTNGGSLTGPAGWNAALPSNRQWSAANPYDQWYGLTWTVASVNRRVKHLVLADLGYGTSITGGVGLTGGLPDTFITLGTMDSLEILDLSGNRITTAPTLLGAWLPTASLRVLNISDNRFNAIAGEVIFQRLLTGAIGLEELYAKQYLAGTAITAGINLPNLPTSLNLLRVLDLGNNGLRGSAALILSVLPTLQTVYLNNNRIEQLSLTANVTVQKLVLDFNELNSITYLQNIVGNYTNLKHFSAQNAMNTGLAQSYTMWSPFDILATNPHNDIHINLSSNKLSGFVDLNNSGFNKVQYLNVSENELTNVLLPTNPLTNLKTLNISTNALNQPLALDWFTKLPAIEVLDMSNNQFYGTLPNPSTVGTAYSLPFLQELSLSDNNLEGAIRLDWLLDAQNNIAGAFNNRLKRLQLSNNDFSEVVLYNGALIPFDTLSALHVDGNQLQFDDLYEFVKAFRMVHQGGALGYRLINTTTASEFLYSPQDSAGLGGVRRRSFGRSTVFRPNISGPILENSADTLYNEYNWYRQGIVAGVFNTEFLGRVRLSQINNPLSGGNVNINLGTSTMSANSLNLLPQMNAVDFGNVLVQNLDSTHNDWIYYVEVNNDSFPFLTIGTRPIRLLVADCYDSLGNVIACQQMLVRYNPDSVAVHQAAPELFKQRIRDEVGAYKVEECLCGDLELWELYDTTNMVEVEQYGTGTRSTAGNASQKTELLSAETNYYVESNNYTPPTTPPITLQGTAHAKPTLVAIIDSGTDFDHPYLKDRFWINAADANNDGIDDDGDCVADNGWGYNFLANNNTAYDDQGHGTAIAGIIGGFSDYNIAQNTGTYDSIAIVPLKFTDKDGNGTLYHAACALYHAAQYVDATGGDSAKIRVVNASWGYYGEPSPSLESAINFAATNCGMLIVTSSGNDGVNNDVESHYPSNFEMDNILSVAAVTPSGTALDSYSNYGEHTVHLAARGDDNTTAPGGTTTADISVYGTSFATAQVARAAGLLFHAYPQASFYAVKRALMDGVDVLNNNDSTKLVSGGKLNLQKSRQVMANILNLSECSNNILVSNFYTPDVTKGLEVVVYPNPFNDDLQIAFLTTANNISTVTIELYSMDGRLLQQKIVDGIDKNSPIYLKTNDLGEGLYLLRINTSEQQIVKKIVKLN